jgi:hypothetical protein
MEPIQKNETPTEQPETTNKSQKLFFFCIGCVVFSVITLCVLVYSASTATHLTNTDAILLQILVILDLIVMVYGTIGVVLYLLLKRPVKPQPIINEEGVI